MYKNYLKNKTVTLFEKYKKYKNTLQMIIRSAEKNYYAVELSNLQNNMAKTWKVLNAMIIKQNSKKIISEINIGGVTSDDPAEISEKLNNFFTNVGPDLAKNIPPSRKKTAEFSKNRVRNSIFFSPTDDSEICDIISSLK